eukprot:TRINITY_DN75728_c0_g1_i1.p1 TRINITY_DN75728_c0_g1~~TRINITY_DN75728_c0_g1_i1.p1  ORF type:complete len:372 (+),score=23.33 TRINITY_DN75728_c0_g1_i1:93-1208(+)
MMLVSRSLLTLAAVQSTLACTYFEVRSPVHGVPMVIANTMEWFEPEPTQPYRAALHPREAQHEPGCNGGERWQGKLGLMAMQYGAGGRLENPFNEAGLSVQEHALRGVGTYSPPNKSLSLCSSDFAMWVATTFETVAKLREVLPTVAVVFSGSGTTAEPCLQWAIADASGDSVVVDYTGGSLSVHDNSQVGVLTNDPEYVWQLKNLNNYVALQPTWPHGNDNDTCDSEVGRVPVAVSHGQNLLGLPGDLSPPSRFVRTFFMRNYAVKARPPTDLEEALVIASGVLDTQTILKGFNAKLPSERGYDYTQYCTLSVPKSRLFFYRTYEDSKWRRVDLSALDFRKSGSTQPSTRRFGTIDVTGEIIASTATTVV